MAKSQGGNEDHAKVKLRVIEFELEGANASVENSIRQLTQALTTRASNPAPRPTLPARSPRELDAPDASEPQNEEFAEPEVVSPDADTQSTKATKPRSPRAPNKPRVMNYLHDLDMTGTGNVTFKEFAAAKKPKNNSQRHLVAAFWLKQYGGSPTITLDKVYSCYSNVGWSTNINDWDISFRSQIQNNRFRRVSPGEYAINPPGEDDVRKMDAAE